MNSYNLKFRNRKAFTLIETLIYIAILGGLLAYFISFTLSISNSRSKSYVASEVNANARIALETIAQKIRLADDVVQPDLGASSDTLSLDMPDTGNHLVFSLEQGVLIYTQASNSYNITSDEVNITNLLFTNLRAGDERDNINIVLTIEYRDSDSQEYRYSKTFQTTLSLRH